MVPYLTDLIGVAVAVVGDNQGHEGAVFNVLFIAGHVDGVLPGLSGPVADVAGAIVLVVALDGRLGRSLNGET